MRSGLSARATRYVQRMATLQMLQACKIERVVAPTYSTTTLVGTAGSRTQIYTGACRIWVQDAPSQIVLGETEFVTYNTVLSLPWNTSAAIKLHDEVELTASPTDLQWVGARFRIQSARFGGQIRPTRSFMLERIGPRP